MPVITNNAIIFETFRVLCDPAFYEDAKANWPADELNSFMQDCAQIVEAELFEARDMNRNMTAEAYVVKILEANGNDGTWLVDLFPAVAKYQNELGRWGVMYMGNGQFSVMAQFKNEDTEVFCHYLEEVEKYLIESKLVTL